MQLEPTVIQELGPYVIGFLSAASGYLLKLFLDGRKRGDDRKDDELLEIQRTVTSLIERVARMESQMSRLASIEEKLDAVIMAGFSAGRVH